MCYAEASRPAPTDVKSAVEITRSRFMDLAFMEVHRKVYDLGRVETDEELERLEKLYTDASALCDKCVDGVINESQLISQLEAMNLEEHTTTIKEFMKRVENGSKSRI